MLGGDFNIHMSPERHSATLAQLLDLTSSYGLVPTIKTPTRITNNNGSVIDNIFTNIHISDISAESVYSNISDHNCQTIKFHDKYNPNGSSKNPIRHYSKRTFTASQILYFNQLLETADWAEVFYSKTTELKYETFISKFLHYFNCAFPKKNYSTTLNSKKKNWITHEVTTSARRLKSLYEDTRRSAKCEDKVIYRQQKQIHKRIISDAKRTFNDNIIENSQNKQAGAWRIIKNHTTPRIRNPCLDLHTETGHSTDQKECANILNNYFCDAVLNLLRISGIKPSPAGTPMSRCTKNMFLLPVNETEVLKIISLKCNKSSG